MRKERRKEGEKERGMKRGMEGGRDCKNGMLAQGFEKSHSTALTLWVLCIPELLLVLIM